MARVAALLVLLACMLARAHSETVLQLDDHDWTLTNGNGSISLNTHIPAYALEVLRGNGVIGDPLYRYGEQDSRWVAYDVWTFSTTISAEDAARLAAQEQVVLYLGGVDTLANVTLNGQDILETNNFHRHWTVPVKPFLDPNGVNTLAITIAPAYNMSLAAQAAHPYHIPTLYNTGSIGAYNFVRKPAFDFGWDWGPAFAASGIHGTVKLVAFSKPTLAGAYLAQNATEDVFNLKVTSQFLVPESGGLGTLKVILPEIGVVQEQDVEFTAGPDNAADLFEASTELVVSKADIQLWWPAGGNYGPHKLYDVSIEFTPYGAACGPVPTVPTASGAGAAKPNGQESAQRRQTVYGESFPGASFLDAFFGSGNGDGGVDVNIDFSDGFKASVGVGDLVDFNINLGGSSQTPVAATPDAANSCSYIHKRIGFRTIELVNDPLPKAVKDLFGNNTGWSFKEADRPVDSILQKAEGFQWSLNDEGQWTLFPGNDTNVEGSAGESYYFRVNGVPIYLKGANVIPMHVLPANVTPELIRSTLQAAVDGNMNLLRVWGGGLYHTDEFYNFCDENGVLIWEDAMFGGSHYPRSPEWLANIQEEITQQAERLSWHPSVAAWCGNNELELSYEWANNTRIRSNRNMFVTDYMTNIMLLRSAIKKVNPSSIFISSSPTKGTVADDGDDYILRWGWIGDTRFGTVHHYDYMSDCENFRSYPAAKFVSEFGWQSYPMPETYAAAMQPEIDWGVGNPMNEFRNRRTDVTPQFLYQYGLHFKLPKDWNPEDPEERMERFKSYLWIGHMQHMRCYETALNFWRRLRSHPTSLTMGAMYWQLNDIWAGASWSSVDISGRWKPVHYSVKRAFAPLAVQAILDNNTVDIFVVSDLTNTVDTSIRLQLVSLNDSASTCSSATHKQQNILSFTIPVAGLFASKIWSLDIAALLAMRPGCTKTTCYLTAVAEADGVAASESQLWLTPFKNAEFPDPEVHIEKLELVGPNTVNITVAANRPAALVLVSEEDPLSGHFSDNAFSINPCEKRVITFTSHKGAVNASDLKDGSFFVESLYDHSSWSDDVAPAAKPLWTVPSVLVDPVTGVAVPVTDATPAPATSIAVEPTPTAPLASEPAGQQVASTDDIAAGATPDVQPPEASAAAAEGTAATGAAATGTAATGTTAEGTAAAGAAAAPVKKAAEPNLWVAVPATEEQPAGEAQQPSKVQ